MALYHVSRGTSVARHLQELYRRHGYYREALVSKYFEGESGLAAMKRLMERLRTRPPSTMAGSDVVCVRDYLSGQALSLPDGVATRIEGFPPSNVLQFILKNGSIITARPSGTEPKVKFYASCRSEPGLAVQKAREIVDRMVDQITGELNRLASA